MNVYNKWRDLFLPFCNVSGVDVFSVLLFVRWSSRLGCIISKQRFWRENVSENTYSLLTHHHAIKGLE